MKIKNGQVAIEFLFVIGFLILTFIGFTILSYEIGTSYIKTSEFLNVRDECLKFSNIVSAVQSGGPGTEIKATTKYSVTFFNYSEINVETPETMIHKPKIAVLASEAGETTQSFYDLITEKVNPVWFKTCFSDISTSGCQKWQTGGMTVETWNKINLSLSDLIENIDDYDVIYLEDSHIQHNAQYNNKPYFDILEDWVKANNVLILAEHAVCREQSSGSYSSSSYRCNPSGGYNNDQWDILDIRLFQRGGSYGNGVTVIVEPDQALFPNLHKDDVFDFEEDSYVNDLTSIEKIPGTDETADNGTFKNLAGSPHNQGDFSKTSLEDCPGSGTSRQCTGTYTWEVGYDNAANNKPVEFNVTFSFNLSSLGISGNDITNAVLTLRGCWNGGTNYCDGGDKPEFKDGTNGNFEVLMLNNNTFQRMNCINTVGSECQANNTILLGDYNTNPSWGQADSYHTFNFSRSSNFSDGFIKNGILQIMLRTFGTNQATNDDIWQEIDHLTLTLDYVGKPIQPEPIFKVIATYDDNSEPAIAQWKLGNGKTYYFGDFQVSIGQTNYSMMLADLIEKSYITLNPRYISTCTFYGNIKKDYQFNGDIIIKNINDEVVISNETS